MEEHVLLIATDISATAAILTLEATVKIQVCDYYFEYFTTYYAKIMK